ncbi:MAG TPA: SDR family oxidoreductase [Solirubrobacterales bacterium]
MSGAAAAGLKGRLSGSTILLTGSSGFLGKAVLSALLEQPEGFRRLLLLLRASDAAAARQRLQSEVLGSDAFAALPDASAWAMLDQGRLCAVAGDLEGDHLDLQAQEGWGDIDTVIHCAASVSFEAPLDEILALNAYGPIRLLDSLHAAGAHPHFVHVSTAYVDDCRQNTIREDGPSHPSLAELDPDAMLEAAQEWRAVAEEKSLQPAEQKRFAREAQRDAAHRPGMDAAERAEERRKRWVEQRLARKGRRYAMEVGWPDTYALTKALGERLLKEHSRQTTIVRPSIIESALRRPRPGWLEGIKVADPLILAYAARGLTHLPGRATNLIDVVPVDHVANVCVAAAAYPPSERHRTLAITSGARNPLTLGDLAGHIKAHFQREPLMQRDGSPIAIGDLRFVDRKLALRKTMRREFLARAAARAGALGVIPMATEKRLRRNSTLAAQVTRMVKIYGPYTELDCVFDDSNTRALAERMLPTDRAELPFDTAAIDWEDYLQGTHLPEIHQMAKQRDHSQPARKERPEPQAAGESR